MKQVKQKHIALLIVLLFSFVSCKKYLDASPNKSLVIPTKIKELQGVLDQDVMYSGYPANTILSDDNFYYTYSNFTTLADVPSKSYVWDSNTDGLDDWSGIYSRVLYCNTVLSVVDGLNDKNASQSEINNVKGSALFYRAYNFFEAAQLFAPQYTSTSAQQGYGIPLKTSPDAEDATIRSTVEQTYQAIITELKAAAPMLPLVQTVSTYKTRPSTVGCYAALARTYLVMGNYDSAFKYADLCLQGYSTLLDFNNSSDVAISSTTPFKRFNNEVIFHAASRSSSGASAAFARQMVDTFLYASYQANDLRKTAFYKINAPGFTFKGNYNASTSQLFSGIAVDEVYLIRAECHARKGNGSNALNDLNTLLIKRWASGTFVPLTTANTSNILAVVLNERRKEMAFRGSRWTDLRRLNLDNNYKRDLVRVVDTKTFTLAANDPRFTFLIPQIVIDNSGIVQNPR